MTTRTLASALTVLQNRAATVEGLVVCGWNDPMDPPCVTFNLPVLDAQTFALGRLTSCEFTAWLVVSDDTYQLDRMVEFIEQLIAAVEVDGTVLFVTAVPGGFADAGSTVQLPAYQLTFNVLLGVEDVEES